MNVTLVRALDVADSHRDRWTLPGGYRVTVRPINADRVSVTFDGRVYRALLSSLVSVLSDDERALFNV